MPENHSSLKQEHKMGLIFACHLYEKKTRENDPLHAIQCDKI